MRIGSARVSKADGSQSLDLQRDATLSLWKSGSVYMLGLQYCTRGRAARAGVDHTAGGRRRLVLRSDGVSN